MKNDTSIFLLTYTDSDGKTAERLMQAMKPTAAMREVIGVKRAQPEDVARVMAAGGKVETVEA